MTTAENSIIESAVQRLKEGLNPLRIYLFGSRAGGGALPDSDYDLMTVVDHSDLPRYKRAQHARRLLSGLDASFDVIVLTLDEWTRQVSSGVSLPNQIINEGKLIHDSGA
jgi:predicted nucleotidyltransferase